MKSVADFSAQSYDGRNMRFGVREFGMAAIWNAIRVAALSKAGSIFITTHDSIYLGEDGPTHQPIETIPSLRMIPGLVVLRPADGNETAGAYKVAVERSKSMSGPSLLYLSRQTLAKNDLTSVEGTQKGAYAVTDVENPELILIATGSELSLAVETANSLKSLRVRVVSMP